MIDTKALREKILDLAMRGKLVPQDPKDEPASELLKRIKAEKEQLIKEKKIRRDKNETEIFRGDDGLYYEKFQDGTVKIIEVPYELPAGWEWTRLLNITNSIQYGYTAPAQENGKAKLLRITDIQNNSVDWRSVPYCDIEENRLKSLKLVNGDIVIARTGGTIGKSLLIENLSEASVFASYLIRVKLNQINHSKFIKLFIESKLYWDQLLKLSGGTGQPNVNATGLKTLLLPIPPRIEEHKIIQEIDIYFKLIQSIEIEQQSFKQLSEQLKKKALDTAMMGKLVPQDPNDEPASVLLEQIREEKQKLYEEGKLKKRDLQESVFYKGDDNSYYMKVGNKSEKANVPYNIPDSWEWRRLSDVIQLISGQDLKKSQYNEESQGIPYITGASNFQNDKIHTNRYTLEPKSLSKKNDLLISVKGTIGAIAFNPFPNSHIARQIMALRDFGIDLIFIQHYLESSIEELQNQAQSMIPGISRNVLLKSYIPIPPKKEINRIVKKISLIKNIIL